MKRILFAILLLSVFCLSSMAQAREIKITSMWGGLGDGQQSELLIARKPKGYYVKGGKIETALVDNLLNAVKAPEVKRFELANLGITPEWLNANAEPAIREYADYYFSVAAPNQKELYFSSFKNPQFIEKILPDVLRGGWSDDYPTVKVEITEQNGSRTVVVSENQPSFMLPWKIERNGRSVKAYNADISRALVALLPKKFANRERLSGEDFRRTLADYVMREIEEDWNLLEVENKAGSTLRTLKETYKIVSAEINPYHGVDFGDSWDETKSPGSNLHLILQKDDFPRGFAISLKLPYRNEKIENLDVFLAKINKYQNLVFSLSWLKDFLASRSERVDLRFITNRSFSEKAMKKFAEDMNKIGKGELVAEVEKEQENIALLGVGGGLEYYQSYWLVMPDKRAILWRYRYPRLLNWKESDFALNECTDQISAGLKCIGAVISPDGNLLSK